MVSHDYNIWKKTHKMARPHSEEISSDCKYQSLRFFLKPAPDFCCHGPPNQNTTPIVKKNLDLRQVVNKHSVLFHLFHHIMLEYRAHWLKLAHNTECKPCEEVCSLNVVRHRGRGWARTPARRRRSRDTSSSSRRSKGSVGRTKAESYKGAEPRYV